MKRKITAATLMILGVICIMILATSIKPESGHYLGNFYAQDRSENLQDIYKNQGEMISGKIKKIMSQKGMQSVLIEDKKKKQYVFHIQPHTIVMTFEKLKVGDSVDIIYNGILTRSIPPQGNTMIINGLKL